jgi:hypothetical protein
MELPHTDLAFGAAASTDKNAETDWNIKGAETCGQPGCLVAIEGSGQDRGAALEARPSPGRQNSLERLKASTQ